MTVSNQNPVADSLLTPADSVSFTLTPNGAITFLQVSVEGASNEIVLFTSTFQPGYSGTQTFGPGDVRDISFSRTAGWDASPFTVKVQWTDDSGSQSTSWNYELAVEQLYPDLMQPRNPVAQGTLITTDNGVKVRTDTGWIDFVGFTVVNLGNGKVRVTDAGGGGGGGGFAGIGQWTLSASTVDSAPGPGNFRLNNTQALATRIFVDVIDKSGVDHSDSILDMKIGQYIKLQNSGDQDSGSLWRINDKPVIGGGGYRKIPVELVSAGTSDLTGLTPVSFVSYFPEATGRFEKGAIGSWWYSSVASTVGDPTPGEFLTSGATATLSSNRIEVHYTTSDGESFANLLKAIKSDDIFWFRHLDSGEFVNYVVGGVVDSGTFLTLTLNTIGDGTFADHTFVDGDRYAFGFYPVADTVGSGQPVGGGIGTWGYAGDADTTPAAGKFSFDTSDIAGATNLYIYDTGLNNGLPMNNILASIASGDWIYIGSLDDQTVGSWHKVNGTPSLAADVYDIPLDATGQGSLLSYSIDEECFVNIVRAVGAGGGGAGMGQWDYIAGGGAPSATQFSANNDVLSTLTTLNFADASGEQNNFSLAFGNVKAGDYLVIRDNAGTGAHGTFLITNAVDNTTYWTFTVGTGNKSGSFAAGNSYDFWVLSAGNVSSVSVIADNALIRGDGGARGVQDTGISVDDTTDDMSGVGDIRPKKGVSRLIKPADSLSGDVTGTETTIEGGDIAAGGTTGGSVSVNPGVVTGGGGKGSVSIGDNGETAMVTLGDVDSTVEVELLGDNVKVRGDSALNGVNHTPGIEIQDDLATVASARVKTSDGNPNGNVTAARGSLCIDVANAAIYQNTDGATSWSVRGSGTPAPSGLGEWRYDTATASADPGAGKFRLNNIAPALATLMYLDDENRAGVDMSTLITALFAAGDYIYLQEPGDANTAYLYEIGTPVDNTGWWTIPLVFKDAGTGTIANNDDIAIVHFSQAGASGGGGADSILGEWNLVGDGFGALAIGDLRVTAGTYATPAGITQFYLETRPLDGLARNQIFSAFGGNNFLKIYSDDESTFWLYQVTRANVSGNTVLVTVTYIGAVGAGSLTIGDDLKVAVITTTQNNYLSITGTAEVTLPANTTDYVTVRDTTGWQDPNWDNNIGATAPASALTYLWKPFRFSRGGRLDTATLRLRCTTGTGGSIGISWTKQVKTTSSTTVVNTLATAETIVAMPVNQTVGAFIASFSSPTFVLNEYFGMSFRRNQATAPTVIYLDYTINYALSG